MSWEDWDDYADRRKHVDRRIRAVCEAVETYMNHYSDYTGRLTRAGQKMAEAEGMTPEQYRVNMLMEIGEAFVAFLNNEGESTKAVLERGSIWKD